MASRERLLDVLEDLGGWRKLLPYGVLLSVTFALYSATLFYSFEWDDHPYIEGNPLIQSLSPAGWKLIWTNSYLGHYAPLHITLLAALYHLWGLSPAAFHIAQLALHASCVCLLYVLLKKLESPGVAMLATLLFVVHPTNVETVAWIAETKSTLAFLFFLAAFLAYVRLDAGGRASDGAWVIALLALSLLSKINTVVAPAVFLAYSYRQGRLADARVRRTLAACFALSAAFVAIHLSSFFNSATTFASEGLEGSYYGGLATHLLNLPFLLFFYVRMLVYPHPLTAWHMFPVRDQFTWMVGAAWLGLLVAAWLAWRAGRGARFWSLWFVAFLAPVLQLIPNLTWVAERYLYIPAIGAFVLFSRLVIGLAAKARAAWPRWCLGGAMAALLIALSAATLRYVPAFQNDVTLWGAALRTCDTSAQCHAGYGGSLLMDGDVARGMPEMIRAAEIRPSARYLAKLGDAFTVSAHDYSQAVIAYQMAQKESPDASTQMKLARALIQGGRLAEAGQALRQIAAQGQQTPSFLLAQAFLRWKQGELEAARAAVEEFRGTTSRPPSARLLLYYWENPAEVGRFLHDVRP